jgi:hypothetical protein
MFYFTKARNPHFCGAIFSLFFSDHLRILSHGTVDFDSSKGRCNESGALCRLSLPTNGSDRNKNDQNELNGINLGHLDWSRDDIAKQ